jgi:cytochrome c oxidase subunit 3/cytochrome o ubiquinol oxidase subunit 3
MRPQKSGIEAKPDGRGRVGMFSLIAAESAIFTIFLVAYLFYLGKSLAGPLPREVLDPPVLYTVCLLLSSVTIYAGVRDLRQGHIISFASWWAATIALGGVFLYGTAREWRRLIFESGFTISTNLSGTTYYALVGLHGVHVVAGLSCLSVVMVFALLGAVQQQHAERADVLSLYWHFVDVVWVVVFTVVYVIGR